MGTNRAKQFCRFESRYFPANEFFNLEGYGLVHNTTQPPHTAAGNPLETRGGSLVSKDAIAPEPLNEEEGLRSKEGDTLKKIISKEIEKYRPNEGNTPRDKFTGDIFQGGGGGSGGAKGGGTTRGGGRGGGIL